MIRTASVSDIFQAEAAKLELEATDHWLQMLAGALEALQKNQADEDARFRASRSLQKLNRYEDAILILGEGVVPGCSAILRHRHIGLLTECNRHDEAIVAAHSGAIAFPEDLLFQFREGLLLPLLYDSAAEIDRHRARFTAGLRQLCQEIRLDTPQARRGGLTAIGNHSNAFLGYQNRDDRDLQVMYGGLAHRIMAACYPQWALPVKIPPLMAGEPLRIGYVSARFRDLSTTRFFLGWLREHDQTRFLIHTWHVGAKRDAVTDELSRASYRFHHFPDLPGKDLVTVAAESIRASDLHVLVFLDIGLDPATMQLAALRLAPVQCMAWDQPITSGLPTIDYALSSDLAEPEGAEAHYSEQLIRLPGVGVSYRKPVIPWPLLSKTRGDFSLRDDSVVYLCCQSIFKFLPGNDDVFSQIAMTIRNAQFVFLAPNPVVGADLRKRLERAFTAAGLSAENHCVVLPQQKHLDYWNLHAVADVFLDTIGWSSGGSVFEAIACQLPVVTMPGAYMRGRQALAILSQLGVTDTIARDKSGYIDCAVRLATDRVFRDAVVSRMIDGFPQLYSDPRSTKALEEFFERAVGSCRR